MIHISTGRTGRAVPALMLALLVGAGCGGVTKDRDGDTDADTDGVDPITDGIDTPVDPPRDDGGGDYAFARTYGTDSNDVAYAVVEAAGGGYVVAGDVCPTGDGPCDVWVIKIDTGGYVVWERSYGGSNHDEARSLVRAPDGGYVVAGTTESFGVGGDGAMWILKLAEDGSIDWQKAIAGGSAAGIATAGGGGYYVVGSTAAFGSGSSDLWLAKLGADGSVDWQSTYGGAQNDVGHAVASTSDDGCVVAGWTSLGTRQSQLWVMKIGSDGAVGWSNQWGGPDDGGEDARCVEQTSDGGYIVAGWTMSYGAGDADLWVFKLDSSGSAEWQNTYGGTSTERGFGVHQTSDGGYLVAARTESFGAGGADMYILKLASGGAVEWQHTWGSTYDEQGRSALETSDGYYVVAGKDAYYGRSAEDFWVIKSDTDGVVSSACDDMYPGMIGSPTAAASSTDVTAEEFSVGPVSSTGAVSDTTASTSDTTCEINEQCRSSD